ncbi:MAG: cation transporter [Aestuariivirga sp.]|nr:cation transporter [Aestuariivirga sp.]
MLLLAFFTLTTETLAAERTGLFAIENMTCALCPFTVHSAIASVPGVKIATVDFEKKQATVVFDGDATTPASIAEASTNSGYPAILIEVTP